VSLLVACSAKGSPGVTTSVLALGLCWPRPAVVVCADPAGDDLRAGVLQATAPAHAGLLELAVAARKGGVDLAWHAVAVEVAGGSLWLVPGLEDPAQSEAIGGLWPHTVSALLSCGRDVLVDAGRLSASGLPPALAAAADAVALVLRPTLPAVDRARPVLSRLTASTPAGAVGARVGVLCVGEAPYRPGEAAAALGVPLLGVLPDDRVAAARLAEGVVAWRRPLLRAARDTAERLGRLMTSGEAESMVDTAPEAGAL